MMIYDLTEDELTEIEAQCDYDAIDNTPSEDEQPSADAEDIKKVKAKADLQKKAAKLSSKERNLFVKMVQFDTLKQMGEALANLKETPEVVWTNLINRLKSIKGLESSDKSVDFNKLIEILLPILAAVAAMMISAKKIEKAAAEHDNVRSEELEQISDAMAAKANKSIVLELCKNNQNGFSY